MSDLKNRGYCRFCGQVVQYEDIDWTIPEDENKGATFNCKCDQAKEYTRTSRKKVTAKTKIELLFGEGAKSTRLPDGLLEILNKSVDLILKNKADKAQVEYLNIKAKVSMTSKGDIKIERNETNKTAMEA